MPGRGKVDFPWGRQRTNEEAFRFLQPLYMARSITAEELWAIDSNCERIHISMAIVLRAHMHSMLGRSVGRNVNTKPNPALSLAPFGRWTLRDKAAQRRL